MWLGSTFSTTCDDSHIKPWLLLPFGTLISVYFKPPLFASYFHNFSGAMTRTVLFILVSLCFLASTSLSLPLSYRYPCRRSWHRRCASNTDCGCGTLCFHWICSSARTETTPGRRRVSEYSSMSRRERNNRRRVRSSLEEDARTRAQAPASGAVVPPPTAAELALAQSVASVANAGTPGSSRSTNSLVPNMSGNNPTMNGNAGPPRGASVPAQRSTGTGNSNGNGNQGSNNGNFNGNGFANTNGVMPINPTNGNGNGNNNRGSGNGNGNGQGNGPGSRSR